MERLARPASTPQSFTFSSVEPAYSAYGWNVRTERKVIEFSAIEVAGAREFTLIGNGAATVQTPPLGSRGKAYRVTLNGQAGSSTLQLKADGEGRLTIPIALGPGNPYQQYSPAAEAASTGPSADRAPFYIRGNGSRFYRTTVLIR